MLLLFLFLPMNLPLLVLVSLRLLTLHCISYSFHFILVFVFRFILKVLLIIFITVIIGLPLFHCTVAVRSIGLLSGIRFHPRLWTNVWPQVHLIDLDILLCGQNLISLRKHGCIVALR